MANGDRSPHLLIQLRRTVAVIGVAVCATLAWSSRGRAFDSYPTPGIHALITRDACDGRNFPGELVTALEEATRQPDWVESSREGLHFAPNEYYVGWHHFDRAPNVTNVRAFQNSQDYIKEQLNVMVASARARPPDWTAVGWTAGRLLHIVQDFYSHSNYVDLPAADQATCNSAVLDATVSPPAGLTLTGFHRPGNGGGEPGLPPGDPYPHDKFCKDSSDKNAEAKARIGNSSKYQLARGAALSESKKLLDLIARRLQAGALSAPAGAGVRDTTTLWDDFLASGLRRDDFLAAYAWHCWRSCSSGGCILDCQDTRVELGPGAISQTESLTILGVADTTGGMDMVLTAADSAAILRFRELTPESLGFQIPARVTMAFDPSWLTTYRPDSILAYYWDPDLYGWFRAPGSVMDLSQRTVSFLVPRAGNFGLGVRPIPSPVAVAVSEMVARSEDGGVDLSWTTTLPTGTRFRVERRAEPAAAYRMLSDAILATGEPALRYQDHGVSSATRYEYRLSHGGPGDWTVAGTVSVQTSNWRFALEACSPNPSRGALEVQYRMPTRAPVSIEVLDVSGSVVRVLARGMRESGRSSLTWDGRDQRGIPAPAGLYFIRAIALGGSQTRKICRLP